MPAECITIRPELEIFVDGESHEYCSWDCMFLSINFGYGFGWRCRIWDKNLSIDNDFNMRCLQCREAGK